MITIGERINVTSKSLGEAMKKRDAKTILEMARKQMEAGADYLDINIGPAPKEGPELMKWLVEAVQKELEIPLSLDTTNYRAMEAGLAAHKGQAIVNSASGEPERLDKMMSLAGKYKAKIIGLCLTAQGIPRDANERVAVAAEIMAKAAEYSVAVEDLYLDPLILPVAVSQKDMLEVLESIRMFKQLCDPSPQTVVGLSNSSNSMPTPIKELVDRTVLIMLMACGLDAAILDPLDIELMKAVKTAEVLRNENLYAPSYLD